jgi:predicted DNA-binding protein
MVRTQIYLTQAEQRALSALGKATGRTRSEIIREAVDEFVQKRHASHRLKLLRQARGLWKIRTDSPDVRQLRRGWRVR